MKLNIVVLLTLLISIIIQLTSCDYTSIKTKRNVLTDLNLSSFLENESLSFSEMNNTNNTNNTNNSEIIENSNNNNPVFTMLKLYNYKDVQYSGEIYVGTPYKKFTVIYDTGSNLFWLPSVNCTFRCRNGTNKYIPELSSTSKYLHIKKNISYAKGYIKGRLFKDKVALNKRTILSSLYNKEIYVDDFKIIAAYKEKYLFRTAFDGIVGLGINDEGDINNSLIKLLYNQNKISVPSFTFYLFSNKHENSTNENSRLYVGDILENDYINNLFKNKIKYCYLPENNVYWLCKSQSIKFELNSENNSTNINKTKTISTQSGIIFDTGTSYTLLPMNDSKYIMDYFNDTLKKKCYITKFHQIICQCNSEKDFGNIKIYFDEENYYQINFEDLIDYKQNYVFQCRFKMLVDKINFGTWVIGDSSLRSSLITFNMQERKISFIQNISKIIDDNKIAKSILINQSLISSTLFWILIIIGVLVVLIAIIYIFI